MPAPPREATSAPASDEAPSTPRRPVRRALRTHLGTVAGAAILGVLLWRLGTGVFLDGLRRIDVPTLLAGLGIGVLTTVFSAWRWCRVARALGIRLPLGAAVADYYRALFLNAALPGGVLGDVHRAVRHGQSAGDMGRGVRAVVLERTAGQVALVAVGVPALLTMPSPVLSQARHLAGLLALGALGALAVVAAVRMGRAPRPSRGRRAFGAALVEARTALLARGSWPAVLLSSVVVLAGHLLMFLVAARVAGSDASPATLLPLALLALIAMGLPLNIGGWGPREGVTAWAFGAACLGADLGLAVAVVYGVLSFVASLPGLVVLLARWYAGLRRPGTNPEPPEGGEHSCVAGAETPEVGEHAPVAGAETSPDGEQVLVAGPETFTGREPVSAVGPETSAGAENVCAAGAERTGGSGQALTVGTVEPSVAVPRPRQPGPERTPHALRAPVPHATTYPRSPPAPRTPGPTRRHDRCRPSGFATGTPPAASSEATREKYASKESASVASSCFPFSAEASEGRPTTPDSV
ncbi:hypothetical protein AAW14_15730 [Streptomyces hygroscopicus]|nr:hypothetical protein [Streptomyces hygroscopicus]